MIRARKYIEVHKKYSPEAGKYVSYNDAMNAIKISEVEQEGKAIEAFINSCVFLSGNNEHCIYITNRCCKFTLTGAACQFLEKFKKELSKI